MSSAVLNPVQYASQVKEDLLSQWHPARISDRKLHELQLQLVKVQQLGGAFADVAFSPQVTDRLGASCDLAADFARSKD